MAIKIGQDETIELRLDQILKERGMTQSRFSEISGIHRQQISNWCRRPSRIDFDTLAKLSRFLDVPVEELLEAVPA